MKEVSPKSVGPTIFKGLGHGRRGGGADLWVFVNNFKEARFKFPTFWKIFVH